MYLSYEEYQIYGGTLDETTFTEYAFEAESQINWYTFNRLENVPYEELDEKVKRCMFALLQKIQTIQNFQNPDSNSSSGSGMTAGIASQSNDGVSISYNIISASDAVAMAKDEIKRTINIYLQGVVDSLGRRVLYRGIYPNE